MIKSVKKAMDILTVLSASAETPISLSDLSQRVGLNKSTCAHIVETMCEELYVEHVSRKDGYRLGPWAYMLSRYGTFRQSLVNVSAPVLKWLQQNLDVDVFVSVLCNGYKYIIYHIESDNVLPMREGSMIQGYVEPTATGRLLMAYTNANSLNHILKKGVNDGKAALSPDMEAELKRIRSNGYAHVSVDVEQSQSFAFRVAEGTATVASVGVLYFNAKDSPEFRERVIRSGKTAAKEISRRLAFT